MGPSLDRSRFAELGREIDDFFMRQGRVWETMGRIAARLTDEGIDYAILGGMSLALHGFIRPTGDVGILTHQKVLHKFMNVLSVAAT